MSIRRQAEICRWFSRSEMCRKSFSTQRFQPEKVVPRADKRRQSGALAFSVTKMANTFTQAERSRIIAAVKGKDTTPELVVRRIAPRRCLSKSGRPPALFTVPSKRGRLLVSFVRTDEKLMIRAVLKNGKIRPLQSLPRHWRDGQELIVEGGGPSDDPADIKLWYAELIKLSARVPAEDHAQLAAALAEQDRQAKEQMRRDMGLD